MNLLHLYCSWFASILFVLLHTTNISTSNALDSGSLNLKRQDSRRHRLAPREGANDGQMDDQSTSFQELNSLHKVRWLQSCSLSSPQCDSDEELTTDDTCEADKESELQTSSDQAQTEYETEKGALEAQVASLEQNLADKLNEIADVQSAIETIEETMKEAEGTALTALETSKTVLEATLDTLTSAAASIVQAIESLGTQLVNLAEALVTTLGNLCSVFTNELKSCFSCEKEPCDDSSDCDSHENGDPHFTTWNGDRFDFHGECDMVHVSNDHLDMHIRTKAIWHNGHYWSGVVLAALRFDDDILELNSLPGENRVSVNGVPMTSDSFTLDGIYPVTNTFGKLKHNKFLESVKVKMSGGQYIQFRVHLDTWNIGMDAHGSDFYESRGMIGYWNKPGLFGRDGVTSYDIPVKKEHSHASRLYATEWEVDMNRGDPILFSTTSTAKCADIPEAPPLESEDEGRRLVDMNYAKTLCDRVVAEGMPGREECIFDVLRSNFDEDVLENPAYADPLIGVTRCVAAPEEEKAAASADENSEESALSCAELGGKCVYRCNTEQYDCRPDAMCIEATDLTVVDAARRRTRKVDFIEGCSCALPKMSYVAADDDDEECMDDPEFEFAIGDGVRGGKSMKKCEWLTDVYGRADKYCETEGFDPDATTMIKSACRGACAEYLPECVM